MPSRDTVGTVVKTVVGVFVFLVLVGMCSGGKERSGTTAPGAATTDGTRSARPTAGAQLSVLSWDFENGSYGTQYITGTVRNNSNDRISYAQIEFALYDKSGAQVGTALDNIAQLDAGGTWKFKAVILEQGVAEAKLVGVRGM